MKRHALGSITFFILLFMAQMLYAQIGSFKLSGNFYYRTTNNNGSSLIARPLGLGYQITNHVSIGLDYGFDYEKDSSKTTTLTRHEIGPYYSYSWTLGDHFVFLLSADAAYVFGRNTADPADPFHYTGLVFRVYPSVGITLGGGWSLKAKFGEISYSQTKGDNMAGTIDRIFILGANGSTIGLGVSKSIVFKKSNQK